MLAVLFVAGLLAVYVQFIAEHFPIWVLAIPRVILLVARGFWYWRCRRLAAAGFGGLSLLGNCSYVAATICPEYMLMPGLQLGWIIVLLPAIGALGAAWAKLATAQNAIPRRSPLVPWVLVVVLAMMPAITFSTVWPLRLAFLACRPSLERLANQAEAGHKIVSPHLIGPFRLTESAIEPDLKIVGLFIDPNPGGRTGLVRVHSESPAASHFALLIGTDTNVELGWGWS